MVENKGATPSRQELIKEVAKQFNAKEDLIVIKHIYSQFGENKTKVIVHIYSDKNKMKMFEHKNLLKKHEKKQSPKPEKAEQKETAQPEKAEKAAETNDNKEKTEDKPSENKEEDNSQGKDNQEEKK